VAADGAEDAGPGRVGVGVQAGVDIQVVVATQAGVTGQAGVVAQAGVGGGTRYTTK
jgi:hypothetical protein